MVVVQACQLSLPIPSLSSSPHITSLLFEPHSLSLALMHSDSSFSLYPSLSPLSISSFPSPQTVVSPPSSSSTFLLLQNPNLSPDPKVLFIVSGPYMGGSKILLRFYILQNNNLFRKAHVVCNQKDLTFDEKIGVLVDFRHGISVRVSGSVNYFAMYSASSSKVLLFAVKMVGDDGMIVKLMRCAVIECCRPIWSISVSFGFLVLGEENGVRVLSLRSIVRGRVCKVRNLNVKPEVQKLALQNGAVWGSYSKGSASGEGSMVNGNDSSGTSEIICNGYLDGKVEKRYVSLKERSVRMRQDSSEEGVCFVAFKSKEIEDLKSMKTMSVKAISIQALSPKKIVILDSDGDLHLLCMSNPGDGSDISYSIRTLPHIMKVQKIAVFPDISTREQTIWVSDGHHSLHMMVTSDVDTSVTENNGNEIEENLTQISGSLYTYAIS